MQKKLESILLKRDWSGGREILREKDSIRGLMSRIYVKDGLMFWRAIEALGVAAALVEEQNKGYAAELIRRYFWSLNDESGGTAWNASEAIGSIMAHNPKECGHFNWQLANLSDDESLQVGVLWGLCNLAIVFPKAVDPVFEKVCPFLSVENAELRGLAVWTFSLMENYAQAKEMWVIPEDLKKRLEQDHSMLEIYIDGELLPFKVSELLKKEVITFYTKEFQQGDFTWSICVASSQRGLCWLSIGNPGTEESELRAWAKKQAPGALVLWGMHPNCEVITQLTEYFAGSRQEFTIPIDSRGTPFQRKVWEELRRIPYGETLSYGEVARNVGNPKGPRAVGMANNRNPIGIITPCHRVVGKSGDLVGYASGLDHKERLLSLEASHCQE
ncbi:O-6-methylguanine DNA methyltransferase [Desulfitobacterium dichloroeliminans LMG P-21439]|uniref:Methylated-DNA--protein-cysteine methyltransferase n=1 Tax=Desulfitobacterium dichloroeliminans (strain LMG P-21439 / DCA1) TaxID=871963 RepID=L0F7F7_DESDL|nr:DVU0298 family protein [Desulfitobacterium dichloroeliminans]AGA68571.1 O-6-methylguanine DNA methyltransferase [Desulfitobacterium dichloroeliminans LMG P-21439]